MICKFIFELGDHMILGTVTSKDRSDLFSGAKYESVPSGTIDCWDGCMPK